MKIRDLVDEQMYQNVIKADTTFRVQNNHNNTDVALDDVGTMAVLCHDRTTTFNISVVYPFIYTILVSLGFRR